MGKRIEIKIKNNDIITEYPLGTSLQEIMHDQKIETKYPIVGAMVNNELEELSYEIFKSKTIKFIDITHQDGMRMYIRSLSFMLMKAIKDLYPNVQLRIEHSVSNGYFCELIGEGFITDLNVISDIESRMREIVEEDIPFIRRDILNKDAINIFKKNNYHEKARLFSQSTSLYTSIYTLGNLNDYFYGYLVPSTGYLKVFDLVQMYNGMLLRIPERKKPNHLRPIVLQDKMFDVFREHQRWAHILNAKDIGLVNEQVIAGYGGELIKLAEALHEKKIAQLAELIKSRENVKLILVSGPSSSGKTTFSKRLDIQLKVAGMHPVQISLDNYFVDRDKTPLDENGDYDFESIDALDLETFNQNIIDLNEGKTVEIPKFSFETGNRFFDGSTLKIHKGTIIIVEGIHALNPKLSERIDDALKFKIYVSALTQIGIDGHNRIPTTDNRLLRRIIRDHKYRGYSALDTLKRWSSVRRGEEKNIFPYQENADVMFNSALLYELGVIKKHAEPLLKEIWQTEPEYAEAARLLKFLSYFKDIPEKEIPPTSILREFLSDSSFHY